MENEKATVTTLASVLNVKEVKQFKAAQKTWESLQGDSMKTLQKMKAVGDSLNMLYARGAIKGLKKPAITDMIRSHFKGLNRRERSEYRKLANSFTDIQCFVDEYNIKSANPTYLVNAWIKAVKEDNSACEQVEMELQGGLKADSTPMLEGETVTNPGKVVAEPQIKQGLVNVVKNTELPPKEVTTQVGYICNQIKTLFNQGKFNADNLTVIEQHLTSCLQHINSVDVPVALAV